MHELGLQVGPWKSWPVVLVHVIQWSCLCQPVVIIWRHRQPSAVPVWLFVGRGLQSRESAVEGTWDVSCVPVAIRSGTQYISFRMSGKTMLRVQYCRWEPRQTWGPGCVTGGLRMVVRFHTPNSMAGACVHRTENPLYCVQAQQRSSHAMAGAVHEHQRD